MYKKIFTVFIVTFLVFPQFLYAQQEQPGKKYNGVIIQPAIEFIDADPGEVYSGSVNLTHDFETDKNFTFYPNTYNFKQSGESGDPEFYYDSQAPLSIRSADWVDVENDSYTLNPGERRSINYTVTIPADAEPGGHYAAIIFSESDVKTEFAEVSLNRSIGELLFITVSGGVKKDGDLLEFKSRKSIYDITPFDFIMRYRNNGNVHGVVGGNIFIHKGDITDPVAILDVNKSGGLTLPGETRAYTDTYNSGFLKRVDGEYKFDFKKLTEIHWGKYSATLKLKHDKNGQRVTTEETVNFWVIPWQLLIPIVILLLIIGFYLYRKVKD